MNKKIFGYAGVIFLLLSVGSSSALIDLTGTYNVGGGDNPFDQMLNTTDSPTFVDLTLTDDLDVADDIYVADKIYHKGDLDTYVSFSPNIINWYGGGNSVVQLSHSTMAVNPFGSLSGIDINFICDGVFTTDLFKVDAGLNKVGILTAAPDEELDVHGNAIVTGTLNVTGVTNSSGGFATDTGVGWSGTYTVD